jgi:hypothetical protein
MYRYLIYDYQNETPITRMVNQAAGDQYATHVSRTYYIYQVFFDIFFHAILLLTTRDRTMEKLFGFPSVIYICFRLLADLFSFTQVSWAVFLQNLCYKWTIVDILAVLMIATGQVLSLVQDKYDVIPNDSSVYYNIEALIVGALWLKVLRERERERERERYRSQRDDIEHSLNSYLMPLTARPLCTYACS